MIGHQGSRKTAGLTIVQNTAKPLKGWKKFRNRVKIRNAVAEVRTRRLKICFGGGVHEIQGDQDEGSETE
jgi:hypothetical protein